MITYAKAQEIQSEDIKTVQDAITRYQETKSKDTLDFIFQRLIPYIYKTGHKRMEMYDNKDLPFDKNLMLEEITSSVIEKLLKHIMSFENQYFGSIYNWIKKVTNNEINDYFKAKKRELLTFDKNEDSDSDDTESMDRLSLKNETNLESLSDNPEQLYLSDELSMELSSLINKLSNKDRLIIYYKFQLEMKNEDIAQVMNVSLSTVAHGVKKAKDALATQVLAYEKKTGTRLHSVAIFQIIGILYYMSTKDAEVPESIYTKVSEQIAEHVAAEATKATGKEVVKRAIKKATDTVTKKIIIGVVATTLVAGTAFSILQKPDNDTTVEDTIDTPATYDTPLLTLDDKTQSRLSVITEHYWKHINPAPIIISSSVNSDLTDEQYVQILKELVVHENMLERKTESSIKMSHQELTDFLQYTLYYPRDVDTFDFAEFFSKDQNGKYIITADKPMEYEYKWTFTSIEQSSTFKNVLEICGYTSIDNEHVKVKMHAYKDSSSLLNGYKIHRIGFTSEHADKNDIIDVLKPKYVEEITHCGQVHWAKISKITGYINFTLDHYLPIVSKKLVVDNVLQKEILTNSENQEYVLVSEAELINFSLNTLYKETTPEEIDSFFTKTSNGEYMIFKNNYLDFEKSATENIILSHAYLHTYCDIAYVFTIPENTDKLLILLADYSPKSFIAGSGVYYAHWTSNHFTKESELVDYINELYESYQSRIDSEYYND